MLIKKHAIEKIIAKTKLKKQTAANPRKIPPYFPVSKDIAIQYKLVKLWLKENIKPKKIAFFGSLPLYIIFNKRKYDKIVRKKKWKGAKPKLAKKPNSKQ